MKNNLASMMSLDLFVSSQDEAEYNAIKKHIKPSKSIQAPIIGFDFYIDYFK